MNKTISFFLATIMIALILMPSILMPLTIADTSSGNIGVTGQISGINLVFSPTYIEFGFCTLADIQGDGVYFDADTTTPEINGSRLSITNALGYDVNITQIVGTVTNTELVWILDPNGNTSGISNVLDDSEKCNQTDDPYAIYDISNGTYSRTYNTADVDLTASNITMINGANYNFYYAPAAQDAEAKYGPGDPIEGNIRLKIIYFRI